MKNTYHKPFNEKTFNKLISFIITSRVHPSSVVTARETSGTVIFKFKSFKTAKKTSMHRGVGIFIKCILSLTRRLNKYQFNGKMSSSEEFSAKLLDYFNFIEYRKINNISNVLIASDILRIYDFLSRYSSLFIYDSPIKFERPTKYFCLLNKDDPFEKMIYSLLNHSGIAPKQNRFEQEETHKKEFKVIKNEFTQSLVNPLFNDTIVEWKDVKPNSQIVILGHGCNIKYPGLIGWKGSGRRPILRLSAIEDVARYIADNIGHACNLTYELFSCFASSNRLKKSTAQRFADTLKNLLVTGTVKAHRFGAGIHYNGYKIKRLVVETAMKPEINIEQVELQGSHKLFNVNYNDLTKSWGFKKTEGIRLADTEFDIFSLAPPKLDLKYDFSYLKKNQ
ncbi:MAG: hypothetical protein GY750_07925 [Lentisphaerae bacterium]|nr:hypothetical protein [Lentisphaerota bacterium]MCP4101335.1 hypothetical protein [Lentisphaerota bacterium]